MIQIEQVAQLRVWRRVLHWQDLDGLASWAEKWQMELKRQDMLPLLSWYIIEEQAFYARNADSSSQVMLEQVYSCGYHIIGMT